MTSSKQPSRRPARQSASDRHDVANRLFFRLYQCANLLHKTGTRAVEEYNLTTQRWAVLGALSRPEAAEGMTIGELARYLKVSRQSLAGVIEPLEVDHLIATVPDPRDRRARLVQITDRGARLWRSDVRPRIDAYYDEVTDAITTDELAEALDVVLRIIGNMDRLDETPT